MTRDEGKARLNSLVLVAAELLNQQLFSIGEELEDVLADLIEVLQDILGRCTDYIFRLWSAD